MTTVLLSLGMNITDITLTSTMVLSRQTLYDADTNTLGCQPKPHQGYLVVGAK